MPGTLLVERQCAAFDDDRSKDAEHDGESYNGNSIFFLGLTRSLEEGRLRVRSLVLSFALIAMQLIFLNGLIARGLRDRPPRHAAFVALSSWTEDMDPEKLAFTVGIWGSSAAR